MASTAIVIPVLEAGASTGRWRGAYTEDGANGMPPHVTLLYPFVDDGALDDRHVRAVAEIVGARPAFEFTLARFGVFPGGDGAPAVLYIAPEPHAPFRELTDALVEAFPEHPPYDGAFSDVVPHLTVAWHDEAPVDEIRADVARAFPIAARASEAWLMRFDGHWRAHARTPLCAYDSRMT
jgi:2'-5' RNA ligase